jgi:hypothetical protein
LPILNKGLTLDTANLTIDCGNSGADIKCVDSSVNNWGHALANYYTRVSGQGTTFALMDCDGLEWSREQSANKRKCIFLQNNSYGLAWISGGAGHCESQYFWIKNETFNPYITINFTAEDYETVTINEDMTIFPASEKNQLHLFLTDMGYTEDEDLISSSEWTVQIDDLLLSQTNGLVVRANTSHSLPPVQIDSTTDNTLDSVACGLTSVQESLVTYPIYGLNVPVGDHDIYCNNLSTFRDYKTFTSTAIKIVNITKDIVAGHTDLDFYWARYTDDYTVISNVVHYPDKPMPNMSVVVRWTTTSSSNGTLFWRMKALSTNWSGGWSGWVQQIDTTPLFYHNITIDNTNIRENYQYQYWVASGATARDNNSDLYYNFTTGGVVLPVGTTPTKYENDTFKPVPMISDAVEKLEINTGITAINWTYFLYFFILVLIAGAGMMISHNPALGLGIFVAGALIFSLMSFLPYYIFTIIAILFAFVLAKLLRGAVTD